MAPQKMIYVKKEDSHLLDQAMQITNESLSNTIMQALNQFVEYNSQETFELITLGVGSCLETEFEASNLILDEFEKAYNKLYANEETDPDYEQTLKECYEFSCQLFKSEIIKFYGRKVFSHRQKNDPAGLFEHWYENLKSVEMKEKLAETTALKGLPYLSTQSDYFLKAIKQDPDAQKYIYPDDSWLIPDGVTFDVYITSKKQFLIHFTPDMETMHEVGLQDPHLLPYIADYVILKELKPGTKQIKGATTNCAITLPPRFILKVINSLNSKPKSRFLDI